MEAGDAVKCSFFFFIIWPECPGCSGPADRAMQNPQCIINREDVIRCLHIKLLKFLSDGLGSHGFSLQQSTSRPPDFQVNNRSSAAEALPLRHSPTCVPT